jgi:glycosyltransferase involved in cell wall biosynthesis
MKIAHIGTPSVGYDGGISAYLRHIVPLQIGSGNEVTCYTIRGNNNILEDGLKIIEFQNPIHKTLDALISGLFGSVHAAFQDYDVVHYHNPFSLVFAGIPKLAGKKIVYTMHGNYLLAWDFPPIIREMYRSVEKMGLAKADEITTTTEELALHINERFGRPATCIKHGAEIIESIEPEVITDKYGLEKEKYVLCLARINEDKGQKIVVRAHKLLRSKGYRLVIAGPVDSEKYASECMEESSEGVIYTGKVEGREYLELLSNCAVLVSPLTIRGLPLVVLEAMGAKKCVIASDIDDKEIYLHTVSFKNRDYHDLARQLDFVLSTPSQAKQIAAEGLKYIELNHSWENAVDKFNKIYSRALRPAFIERQLEEV